MGNLCSSSSEEFSILAQCLEGQLALKPEVWKLVSAPLCSMDASTASTAAHQRVIFHAGRPGGSLLGERGLCHGQGQVGGGRRGAQGAGVPGSLPTVEEGTLGIGQSLN
ncbi:hypothetical protein MHYP_G00200070 [Metynnis hypsauchen]